MEKELDFVIELNVGGKKMSALKSTLTKETNSMLAMMVTEHVQSTEDKSGRVFLDCDPDIFRHVLDFLRFGLHPPHDKVIYVYEYAKHFGIRKMVDSLEQFKTVQYKKRSDDAKSKLDPEKYKTLKQKVIDKLAGLSQDKDQCFCIATLWNAENNTPYCSCEVKVDIGSQMRSGQTIRRQVVLSKHPIPSEISVTDDNLLKALGEDLYHLRYGKLRYMRAVSTAQIGCMKCHRPFLRERLFILLSKKYQSDQLDTIADWNHI